MFSQLLDLLPLLTLLILKHLKICENWFYFYFKLMEQADLFFLFFSLFGAMWSAKVFLFQFFDGASQSGNHPHKRNSSNLARGHRGK
jgi:hypothetical protein